MPTIITDAAAAIASVKKIREKSNSKTMPTIITNPTEAVAKVTKLREKSIGYALIDLAKSGALNGSKFIGFNADSEKCVFVKSGTQYEISPFALCQRKESTVAQPPQYEFTEGAMAGIPIELDPVVAVVKYLFTITANTLNFRASSPKTVSIWNRTKGEWYLRENTTDLIIELATAPAPKRKK